MPEMGHSDATVKELNNLVLQIGALIASLNSTQSLNALLNGLFGTTQGTTIYRGSVNWAALSPGTANQRLLTGGASANPSWGGGLTSIASGSLPAAATLSLTGIPALYNHLVLQLSGVSSDTATRHPRVQVSTNNGVSYDTTAASYIGETNAASPGAFSEASLIPGLTDGAAAVTWTSTIVIWGYQGGPNATFRSFTKDSSSNFNSAAGAYIGATSAINALQVLWNGSGNFDAGTYGLWGVT